MRVLLVNPPIYDFAAYDFWLRPYGMLRVAGKIKNQVELSVFDYLVSENPDQFGRGDFPEQIIPKPEALSDIPRRYRRFGRAQEEFRNFLSKKSYDAVLIQTVMTYWYLGVKEVIEDLRELQPQAKIILGGVYATLCPEHAHSLGADFVHEGTELSSLWKFLNLELKGDGLPYWDENHGEVAVMKITEGCPFRCTYCSVPYVYPQFHAKPLEESIDELKQLQRLGVQQVAFYDDALLFKPEQILIPFLERVLAEKLSFSFHTPNALNARFIDAPLAQLMVRAGFKSFFLGFESSEYAWQKKTGGKVYSEEFSAAVRCLENVGADSVGAYIIIGHPDSDGQALEDSIRFASDSGARVMLSDFAPIPHTPDGEKCKKWVNLEEPLNHNKTAFTIRRLGVERETELKNFCRQLNAKQRAKKIGRSAELTSR